MVEESIYKAARFYIIGGQYKDVDIVRHTIETWEKPSSAKKVEKYFIVGGKYKFKSRTNLLTLDYIDTSSDPFVIKHDKIY